MFQSNSSNFNGVFKIIKSSEIPSMLKGSMKITTQSVLSKCKMKGHLTRY